MYFKNILTEFVILFIVSPNWVFGGGATKYINKVCNSVHWQSKLGIWGGNKIY